MTDRPGGDPNQEPTQKRLEKSWKEGETAWSPKIGALLQLIVIVVVGSGFIKSSWRIISEFARDSFSSSVPVSGSMLILYDRVLNSVMPLAWALAAAGLVAGFLQLGVRFNIYNLAPRLSNINPVKGFKRLFSLKKIADMFLALLFTIAVLLVLFYTVYEKRQEIIFSSMAPDISSTVYIVDIIYLFGLRLLAITLVFGVFDYYIAWKRYRKNLMMTRYEVEKETRQDEGDPAVKSQRRQLHQEFLMSTQLNEVKEADIVIINPVRIAVALKYNNIPVPTVIASGENQNAAKIRKEAERNGIPVYRDIKLARSLKDITPGKAIPAELFESVAIILATLESEASK